MTSAQVVETSVITTYYSSSQDYTHPDVLPSGLLHVRNYRNSSMVMLRLFSGLEILVKKRS